MWLWIKENHLGIAILILNRLLFCNEILLTGRRIVGVLGTERLGEFERAWISLLRKRSDGHI